MKMEMSIKLICQLSLLWFFCFSGQRRLRFFFFFSTRELKEQVPERPQADPEVLRPVPQWAGSLGKTPFGRRERGWGFAGGSAAFLGQLQSAQLRLH